MWKTPSTCVLLVSLILIPPAFAQSPAPPPRPLPSEETPQDPLGRSTPRGTVLGFIKAAQTENYPLAVEFLDTRQPAGLAQGIARELKVILDRGLRVNLDTLSTKLEGDLDDGLPTTRELVGVVKTDSGSLNILLDRIQRGQNPPVWLFASETLRRVPEISEEIRPSRIEAHLPRPLHDIRFLNFSIWQWIAVLLAVPLALAVASLLSRALIQWLRPVIRRLTQEQDDRELARIAGPFRLLVLVVILLAGRSLLGLPLLARYFWTRMATALAIVAVTWLLVRLIDIVAKLTRRRLERTNRLATIAILRLIRRLSKAATVTLGGLFLLYLANVDLTAALAGLGLGGIALAFAAQKTLENFFGGIMVISDQPVRVGDFCRFGDRQGTIEDIGLNSTRIRTLDRTVVSVPNGQLAAMSLENFALRDKIWFHPTIGLRYETTADQLRYVLAEVRKMLYKHPRVESISARIRFIGFGQSSLNLEVFAYVLTADYAVFLQIQEDLLLRIMDIIAASGTGVAFPSQTTYIARDSGLDTARSQAAVDQVRGWREQKDLPFPDFPPERIAEFDNTLEYPPPESAVRNRG